MEMEFVTEFTAGSAHDRARHIIRGKRTKRLMRPCSPFGTAATTTTSSSSSGGGGGAYGGCVLNYYSADHQSSSEMSTEEEEDMANCLIMLAQSVSPVKEEKSPDNQHLPKTEKGSSRRFTEMATNAAGGKAGFYVYECKTCNRAFPSFQALGGHRASHKKPKLTVEEKKSGSVATPIPRAPSTECSGEDQSKNNSMEDEENKIITNNSKSSSSPPPGFPQTAPNTKGKVHECSICGSEFLSGQALGGHMRRHRTTPPATASNQIGISTNINSRSNDVIEKPSRSTNMLSLDLNLPAPEMVDDIPSKFQFPAGSSQQHLVFSAPALVDCHY